MSKEFDWNQLVSMSRKPDGVGPFDAFCPIGVIMPAEQLYQAIKARLITEIQASGEVVGTGHNMDTVRFNLVEAIT